MHAGVSQSTYWVAIVIIIATAATADVGALLGTLAVERDWVVVVTGGDSEVMPHLVKSMQRVTLLAFVSLACPFTIPLLLLLKIILLRP